MQTHERVAPAVSEPVRVKTSEGRGRRALFGGGTDGNEQLTAITGLVLILLLAVIGITILRIRQLTSVHLFVGLLLMGPVALKMGSTGYRLVRYYANDPAYRGKGPPLQILRAIAPIVVISTVVVFVTGLLLLFGGAQSRDRFLELHKVSFIIWIVFTGLHVLGHLPGLPEALRATGHGDARGRGTALSSPGDAGRWFMLVGALVGGLVLAIVLIPDFASWTAQGAFPHHHDG